MAFTTFDLFPGIVTMFFTFASRFDRLTIHNGRARFGFAPKADANFTAQGSIDLFPDASLFPLAEIQVDGTPVR